MDGTKKWFESRGVIGGAVAALAGVLGLFGYAVTADEVAALTDATWQFLQLVTAMSSLIGGAWSIIGRIRASKKIAP